MKNNLGKEEKEKKKKTLNLSSSSSSWSSFLSLIIMKEKKTHVSVRFDDEMPKPQNLFSKSIPFHHLWGKKKNFFLFFFLLSSTVLFFLSSKKLSFLGIYFLSILLLLLLFCFCYLVFPMNIFILQPLFYLLHDQIDKKKNKQKKVINEDTEMKQKKKKKVYFFLFVCLFACFSFFTLNPN